MKNWIIDGHQDISSNSLNATGKDFWQYNRLDHNAFNDTPALGQCDYPRLQRGDVKIVFSVIFPLQWVNGECQHTQEACLAETRKQLAYYHQLEQKSEGKVRILRAKADLDYVLNTEDAVGLFLLLEDASAISPELTELQELYESGLRAIGPVWNLDNHFGGGTNTDNGITEHGKNLLQKMQELGVVLDTAHMNPTTFTDSLTLFDGTIINSHTCTRALHEHRRNLSDEQLQMLVRKDAVVGCAFVPEFLHSPLEDARMADVLKHIDHMVQVMGIEHVALGSDFDGMSWPQYLPDLKDNADMQHLAAMINQVYGKGSMALLRDNWLRVLRETLR